MMSCDLFGFTLIEGAKVWMLDAESFKEGQLLTCDRELAISYAVKQGFTNITEWRDGKQFCTHYIPKQTLGKGEWKVT